MNKKRLFPTLSRFFPAVILCSFVISGCSGVRFDDTTIQYSVGSNSGATDSYLHNKYEDSKVYTNFVGGKRYTISQYDDATAHYTYLRGNRSKFQKGYGKKDGSSMGQDGYGQNQAGSGQRSGEGMSMVLEVTDVLFEFDKWVIKDAYYPTLNRWLEFFKENPEVNAQIFGHADSTGPAAYNDKLSERRAEAVVNFLVDRGVERSRFTVVGYGESLPVAPNTTREGRQRNRRVEMDY